MLLTRSKKTFDHKPNSLDFNNLEFYTEDCTLNEVVNYALNGYVITFNFKDRSFFRKQGYMKNNYESTQFIAIDVDHATLAAEDIISKMEFKPTFWHTSYSHQKDGENKYHFYICFREPIYGEDNYRTAYNKVIEGIEDLADSHCKDCHRMIFTSNHNAPNHRWGYSGNVYEVPEECSKIQSDSNIHIVKQKNAPERTEEIPLFGCFWKDFRTVKRNDFLLMYQSQYPFYYETPIDFQGKSYCDLSNMDYYIVNPIRYKYDTVKQKRVRNLVRVGGRHDQLFKDAIQFRAVNPNITLEGLVVALSHDVLYYYENSDGEMSNYAILETAKKVMGDSYTPIKSNKKMKVNMTYFGGSMSVQQKVGQAKKDLTDDRIAAVIEDIGLRPTETAIEVVLSTLEDNSVRVTKKRLLQFCNRLGMEFPSQKDLDHRQVQILHEQNPDLSSRQLEVLCKSNGIDISYRTIQTIIKNSEIATQNSRMLDIQPIPLWLQWFPNTSYLQNYDYTLGMQDVHRCLYAS